MTRLICRIIGHRWDRYRWVAVGPDGLRGGSLCERCDFRRVEVVR